MNFMGKMMLLQNAKRIESMQSDSQAHIAEWRERLVVALLQTPECQAPTQPLCVHPIRVMLLNQRAHA